MLSVGPFRLTEGRDVEPVRGPLSLARAIEVDFGAADESCWFSFNFSDSSFHDLRAFKNPWIFVVTHPVVSVRYRDEWSDDGMDVAFSRAVLNRYHRDRTNHFQILDLP